MTFFELSRDDCVYEVRSTFHNFRLLAKIDQKKAILATPFFFYLATCSIILALLAGRGDGEHLLSGHLFLTIALGSGIFSVLLSYLILNLYALRYVRLGPLVSSKSAMPVSLIGFEVFVVIGLAVAFALDSFL